MGIYVSGRTCWHVPKSQNTANRTKLSCRAIPRISTEWCRSKIGGRVTSYSFNWKDFAFKHASVDAVSIVWNCTIPWINSIDFLVSELSPGTSISANCDLCLHKNGPVSGQKTRNGLDFYWGRARGLIEPRRSNGAHLRYEHLKSQLSGTLISLKLTEISLTVRGLIDQLRSFLERNHN